MIDCVIIFHVTEPFFNKIDINIRYIKLKTVYFIKYVMKLAIIKLPIITKFI